MWKDEIGSEFLISYLNEQISKKLLFWKSDCNENKS